MSDPVLKGRIQFLLLAALFAAPLLAAWILYFVKPDWQPEGRTNYGDLVVPVKTLPDDFAWVDAEGAARGYPLVRGHWSLVMPLAGACDARCAEDLHDYRQAWLLLNEKRLRVKRVVLAPNPEVLPELRDLLGAAHPDLSLVAPVAVDDSAVPAFQGAPAGSVFVVDPLGNVMMVFPPQPDHRKVLKDVKRLLRLSQIG
jgi:hypothetical protein